MSLGADDYCARLEGGELPVETHNQLLRIVFIYLIDFGMCGDDGMLNVVDQIDARGWSFGRMQGDHLELNRTFDLFYISQALAGIYRSQYYSSRLLLQPATARFCRLPDLLHLPGSGGAIGHPRNKATATGHVTKLPRQEDGRGWEPAYGTEEAVAFMPAVARQRDGGRAGRPACSKEFSFELKQPVWCYGKTTRHRVQLPYTLGVTY
ncbi:hypothetical protein MCOR27_004307 [Pyricularia oryzae]|uniref:Uncharacterized protein n=1 Tax=Pyricularia grisea TaxID=148305 RepID=A0ABQ8P129_PYRGI|nr:hypothetical protein MCOR01_000194 [Pyricularia oryzae]KAI6304783.1 hypothetical protein MCOR33_000295 [Pyricularia grisea]KAH9428092.1 hypothetical protein MCOR02_011585 [Pyricularia oryzae]KAI6263446.1 hypothetical protein MCOR19_000348 [Pyricularia oryzae]KAI6281279.1 hypothetical protein MCOR27_004307 [Pyricularia oryzae]